MSDDQDKWRILTRVRDIRVRAALNDVTQERRAQARAAEALEQARQHKAQLEDTVLRARRLLTPQSDEDGQPVFNAVQAQDILGFMAGTRVRAVEAGTAIRRAQLQCARAQESVDQASARYRREASRKEAVASHWQKLSRAARRVSLDREDASAAEDRAGIAIVRGEWDAQE
jgi:hypothetical protein